MTRGEEGFIYTDPENIAMQYRAYHLLVGAGISGMGIRWNNKVFVALHPDVPPANKINIRLVQTLSCKENLVAISRGSEEKQIKQICAQQLFFLPHFVSSRRLRL